MITIDLSDGGIDWPAWVQAVGSVVAIIASSGLALWVPTHIHHKSEKNVVQRAINALIVGIGLTDAAVRGLITVLEVNQFSDHTVRTIDGFIKSARRALSLVPDSMHLGSAYTCVGSCEVHLATVEELIAMLRNGASPSDARDALVELLPDVAALSSDGAKFMASKDRGPLDDLRTGRSADA